METNHPEPSVETSQHRLSDLRLLLRQLTSRRPRLPLLRTSQRALHAAPRNAPALRTSVLDRIRRRATQASTNLCLIGGMAEVTVEPFPPLGQLGVPPPAPEKRCTMCTATAKEVGAALIRPCSGCVMLYCSDCMRDQFVLAIRESDPISFPPECDCGCIIPLHAAIHHLDLAFQFRYRARFDVWSAAFPLYCPVGSGNSQHTSELSGDVGSNHDLDDMDRESLDLNEEPAEPLDGEFGKCAHLFVVYEPHGLTEQAMSAKIDFLINNVTTLTESELEENQPEEQLVPPEDMECHRCWKKVYWKPKAPLERPFSSLELAYAPHTFGRYLRRSFVASNIPDGVSLKDIRTKLTRIVKDVTRSGSLCTIDWDKVPLPPQLTLRKHSGFRKNFDFSQSNQTLTVPVEGAASNADELPNETPTAYVCDCASCGYLVCFDCQHLLTRRLVAAEATDVEEEGRIL
ncbi:hypothetical protein FH972_022692 [Carpinus fangiana]|uniref:IBR domain-containing protein n=1 Tax=Carpinus fangiana TaxID=176857 RepID=A0A5N6KSY5_9ROSI|nr:hypothetical protein FH972_022692 [Carpinus fangiana]